MKKNLAVVFREHNIQVGDLIELVNHPHWFTRAIEESEGEECPASAEGTLLEVTAIGEEKVLGYVLASDVDKPIVGDSYKASGWKRYYEYESCFDYAVAFRKVGTKVEGLYQWLYPDLVNVYTRCQSPR